MKLHPIALALVASSVLTVPAHAQSAKDFKLLRQEVQRLRAELEALKQQSAKPAPAAAAPVATAPVAAPVPAEAPAVSTAALAERVEQVEMKQKDAVVAGDIPGSFRLPGSETSIKLYGYVEVNAIHDAKGDNSNNDYSTFLPYVPLNGSTQRKGQTYVHARTSRLGIESATPTAAGVLGVKIEGDFNNDPRLGNSAFGKSSDSILTQQALNGYNFRLRQAIGTFAGFTVGQTWSTFMDIDNAPETVDFNGPIGNTFIRQPVIRYTYNAPDIGGLTVALENPVSYAYYNSGSVVSKGFSRSPDLVLRWDRAFDWGTASLRGVTQEVKVIRDANPEADDEPVTAFRAAKRGYGIAGTSLIKVRDSQDSLSLGFTYGQGIGRYLNYIEGAFVDEASNRILMERAVGITAGYQYKASDTLRSNVVLGWQENYSNDYTRFAVANGLDSGQYGINKSMYQLHTGVIYNPVKNVDLGAEYIWGQRKTLAGEKGDLSRFNLMARYTFN